MCLAVPGKIVKINGHTAIVDYELEKREVGLLEPVYKVGDWVIVQGRIVIQKIPAKQAQRALAMYKKAVAED